MESEIYFGKETINRVSFLRDDADFIVQAIRYPHTQLLFVKDDYPLVTYESSPGSPEPRPKLLKLPVAQIKAVHQIFQVWGILNKSHSYALRKFPNVVFLGLANDRHSGKKDENGNGFSYKEGRYTGTPVFMVDVSLPSSLGAVLKLEEAARRREHDQVAAALEQTSLGDVYGKDTSPVDREKITAAEQIDVFAILESAQKDQQIPKFEIVNNRGTIFKLANEDGSLFSYGKMYIDWLNKQNFCPQCGAPVIKIHSGTKLLCTSQALPEEAPLEHSGQLDVNIKKKVQYVCPSRNALVLNIQFPRIDPVCIIAVMNREQNKILLGNSLRFPLPSFYSCVAGFMEPGETIETCCKREVWEETGVTCLDVVIAESQPWPFPVSLMIGCIGVVDFNGTNEKVDLGHDPELRDARWFDVEEVAAVLEKQTRGDEYYKGSDDKKNEEKNNNKEIILPPKTAIAHNLISMVIHKNFPKL